MTIEERLENMEQELGRVKRCNRWLLGAILLVAGGLIVFAGFETTASRAREKAGGTIKEVHAKKFILEDENGKARADLSASESGPSLSLSDENGETRVSLAAYKGSPNLSLRDKNGKVRVSLSASESGPSLSLWGKNGKAGVSLYASESGPYLLLCDKNGTPRADLSVFRDNPSLLLWDEKGENRFIAGKTKIETPDGKITEYPEYFLILCGPDGKVIWSAIK